MAKMAIYILPQKEGAGAPKPTKMTTNGGCPSDKTTVCQKHRFRHPEFWGRNVRQEMVVATILDHFGPAHLPAVPQPLLIINNIGVTMVSTREGFGVGFRWLAF